MFISYQFQSAPVKVQDAASVHLDSTEISHFDAESERSSQTWQGFCNCEQLSQQLLLRGDAKVNFLNV